MSDDREIIPAYQRITVGKAGHTVENIPARVRVAKYPGEGSPWENMPAPVGDFIERFTRLFVENLPLKEDAWYWRVSKDVEDALDDYMGRLDLGVWRERRDPSTNDYIFGIPIVVDHFAEPNVIVLEPFPANKTDTNGDNPEDRA